MIECRDIILRVHIRGGKIYDFTELVNTVTWSGDYRSPSRTLEVTYTQSNVDNSIPKKDVLINSTCCFYVEGKEIFRGNLIEYSKASNSNQVTLTFKDIGHYLLVDKKNYNFSDKSVDECAKKVLSEGKPKLTLDKLEKANTKVTKIFIGKSAYEIIMSLYTLHKNKTNSKDAYMVYADLDKVNVVKKGITALSFEFSETNNLESTDIKESLDGFINRVVVVDEKGNKIKEKINKDLMKIYNAYATEVITQKEKETVSTTEIDSKFVDVQKTISLTGYGDITCKTGMKVNVVDNYTKLKGIFYIDKDTHTWSNGIYSIKLDLNFKNLMDEMDVSENEDKGAKGGVESTKDWGHGVTAEQLNKVLKGKLAGTGEIFLKYANMYKINPAIAAAIAMHESGGTSRLAKEQNNFFGMRNKNGWMKFSSVDEGIRRGISNISRNYVNKGKNSLQKMVKDYAEGGKDWIPQTSAFYKQITGKNVTTAKWGSGVKTEAEAKSNIVYQTSSGSGNSIVSEAEQHLGKTKFKSYFTPDYWCADFVTYCLQQSGKYTLSGKSSSCVGMASLYSKKGRLKKGVGGYTPKPGDTIFFKTSRTANWTNHVGLVRSVSGTYPNLKITTVEGNTSGKRGWSHNEVWTHTYNKNGARGIAIVAYGIN